MATKATTVKKQTRFTANWLKQSERKGKLRIDSEWSVKEAKDNGYSIANKVRLNSNDKPYLIMVDNEEETYGAVYMFKPLAESVDKGDVLKPNQISIYLCIAENEEGREEPCFIIGTPNYELGEGALEFM